MAWVWARPSKLSAFALKRAASCTNELAAEVLRLSDEGVAADAAEARAGQTSAELVWTGPEVPDTSSRDTAIVVPELWLAPSTTS